jgi:hypothetical protein
MLDTILLYLSTYLIEIMTTMLFLGLITRWSSYKQSKNEDAFFSKFIREIEKNIIDDRNKNKKISNVDNYLENLLKKVSEKLPTRNIREKKGRIDKKEVVDKVSFKEYSKGDKNFLSSIKIESESFKSKFPPNYNEITDRVLGSDSRWSKLYNILPMGLVSRLIDILPRIFVVFGILGTFIGISKALPVIAKVNISDMEASSDVLGVFVLNVTYAMKTSIAGILYSLIMTFLNTAAPVEGIRNSIHKKMCNCFEMIWLTVSGKNKSNKDVKDLTIELIDEVKKVNKKISEIDKKQIKAA